MVKKLILSRPKILHEAVCPKCSHPHIEAKEEVDIMCNNCNTKHSVPVQASIYFSAAKKLNNILASNNEVWVMAQRDNSQVVYSEDELKPRSRMEDAMYHAIIAIQKDYQRMLCWEVSDIDTDTDFEYRQFCNNCGYCNNCLTCTKCNTVYQSTEVAKGKVKQKRYKCPECGSRSYKRLAVEKFEKEKGKLICPQCRQRNIVQTITVNNKACHKCNSEDVTKPRKIYVYKLVIKRQRRFRLPE